MTYQTDITKALNTLRSDDIKHHAICDGLDQESEEWAIASQRCEAIQRCIDALIDLADLED